MCLIKPEIFFLACRSSKSILDDSLPFRLSNLVANAKLELVAAKQKISSVNSSGNYVQIKIIVDETTIMHSSSSSSTIWSILRYFESQTDVNVTQRTVPDQAKGRLVYEIPTVQLFSTHLTTLQQLSQSLESLGIAKGSVVLRVRFQVSDLYFEDAVEQQKELFTQSESPVIVSKEQSPEPEQIKQLSKRSSPLLGNGFESIAKEDVDEDPTLDILNGSASRQFKVYVPSTTQRHIPDDAEHLEMNANQFRLYQSRLQGIAGPKNGPLLTENLRNKLKEEKKAKIMHCVVRIRLPDQSHLEANFKADETVRDVIDFVRSLLKASSQFVLFITPPRKNLTTMHHTLVKDCNFGARELLFLEWTDKADASGLKDSVLSTAVSISEIPSIKQDEQLKANENENENGKTQQQPMSSSSAKTGGGGKPKWMRLSKK